MAEMLSRQHAKRTCARRMTPSTSARLYRSGVKMTIRTKEVDEDDNIWLHGYMDDDHDIANANRKDMLDRLMGLTQIEMEMEVEDLSAPGRKLLEEEVVLEISGDPKP
ncbi:unnamed protein product [Enterobius vermicularis]|uniref:DUF2283 domain-containing protein n=1 Tax=Enterobius vermicularis TaxID=51028 RepID=A0A0N4VLP9_ENTVE|nr:unnamed protein product [Enterobius vermicularis]